MGVWVFGVVDVFFILGVGLRAEDLGAEILAS